MKEKIDELSLALGKAIRARRLLMDWTQEKLSEHSGVAPSQISEIENGKAMLYTDTLFRIAKGFGLKNPSQLFDDDVMTFYHHFDPRQK